MAAGITGIIEKQRAFFMSGKTRDINFRIDKLKKLKELITRRNNDIIAALEKDFRKSGFETYTSEIAAVTDELNHAIKNLHTWANPQKVKTPIYLFKSTSSVHCEPYGIALIIGAWNYPLLLVINPLIGAIAAGNCAVVKPSELSTHTSHLVAEIIGECFVEDHCTVVEGGVEETTALLNQKLDFIFFTGSTAVGKVVAQAAARNLTPVVLELGGKSPCIVTPSADIATAARRITWGKFVNAGQICIAPDYLLVHRDVKDELLKGITSCIKEFYGDAPDQSPDYSRIINLRHFDRLAALLERGRVISGGITDRADLYIEPTVIDDITWDDPIMQEEIFGPLLPVLEYQDLGQVISMVNEREKPLALYLFSRRKEEIDRVLTYTSSGGVSINATLLHVSNLHLPFGGVGSSGMGSYHGRASFDAFSHKKSVLDKSVRFDSKLVYPPYKEKLAMIKKLMG